MEVGTNHILAITSNGLVLGFSGSTYHILYS